MSEQKVQGINSSTREEKGEVGALSLVRRRTAREAREDFKKKKWPSEWREKKIARYPKKVC